MIINNHNQSRVWVLCLMMDNQVRTRQDIYQGVIDLAKISDDEIGDQISSGQSRLLNSLGWAISSFVKAGVLNRISRSIYQVTPLGLKMAKQWKGKAEITEKDFIGLNDWDNYQKNLLERKKSQSYKHVKYSENLDGQELDFKIQAKNAIKEIETEIAVELLNKLQQSTPLFFEKAVLKLLLAMGYGGKENLFEHTGKSHDGGIDGVIKQDPLGIQNIYIQAKRYASNNTVGSKELQSFLGALQGNGVERGVFITTSSFTKSAKEYAQKLLGKIVLIDGQELVTLMIKYKVGIQIKEVLEICEIDDDFFE
ncbi:restriction endonuclease [Moraxella nasovis]|uniref:restriction endonuclease n=1 Tax=Moraxella nasovis TaxID=2904121 RepID=UPI001F6249B5|nr:restriction endonuclease [Moraxella nasovis]UNU73063.1 restriction endonuclease [Moraxella nasovis]